MPRDWDAATEDRVPGPQTRWGRAVLHRLPLAGDERVLDAGCGDVLPLIPDDGRAAFVHAVATRMELPEIDYVRLNIDARRA